MSFRFFDLVKGLAVATILSSLPTSSPSAETCLQRFSCTLYGECRLPCLDDVLGTRPAAPEPAKSEAQVRPPAVKPSIADAAKTHKLVRREVRRPLLAAARDVDTVDELAGKPVSFGPNGSPSQAMGRQLFARLGIKVAETPLDLDNALDGVATGDIAAALLVKPSDVARLKASGSRDVHVLVVPGGVVAQGE